MGPCIALVFVYSSQPFWKGYNIELAIDIHSCFSIQQTIKDSSKWIRLVDEAESQVPPV